MTLTQRQRLATLSVVLLTMLVISAVSSNQSVDDGVVRPVIKSPELTLSEVNGKALSLDPAKISRSPEETPATDLFASKSWLPPPPSAPVVVAPPPAPMAPPLPFRYVGQLGESDGKVVIYLAQGDDVHTVRVGEQIAGQYRLDSMDESKLTLTYLPMNQQQMLVIPPR